MGTMASREFLAMDSANDSLQFQKNVAVRKAKNDAVIAERVRIEDELLLPGGTIEQIGQRDQGNLTPYAIQAMRDLGEAVTRYLGELNG